MSILFKNISIIDSVTNRNTNILIQKDSFYELTDNDIGNAKEYNKIIEKANLALMPSFIDLHCHLREPGYTYKEDLYSGGQAALAGGFTTICCMANTKPVGDNPATIQYIRDKAKALDLCQVIPIAAVTENLKTNKMVNFKEMIQYTSLFSNDGQPISDKKIMIEALLASAKYQFNLLTHCEPEVEMIERDLQLLESYGGNLHICHVSKRESVELIRTAKRKGLKLTCEVTPHHLFSYGLDYLVNPPFGKKYDREALWEGLLDGTIDIIATDHAPHSKEDKLKGATGLIGLEHAFSLVYTIFKERNINLQLLSQLMSEAPAKLLNIPPVRFNQVSKANLVLLDLEKKYVIMEKDIISKSKNTPFLGQTVSGQVLMTIKDGQTRYSNDIRYT
ncbi:MAG: dihydroorotase [Candidatus Atribacteria bacterium]|nr:dihydroorotase [Candidatus Atribacteria bacterium]